MSEPEEARKKPPSTAALVLLAIGVVGALAGLGRCGAFGRGVDDYGISGAFCLVVSVIVLFVAMILYVRSRS